MKKDIDFMELFDFCEEYPDNLSETGVPQDTLFEYVSNTFLNGLINYVEPFFVCVVERYKDWDEENIDFKKWDKIASEFHTNYIDIMQDDDIILLAESKNSWWYFYSDGDVSDCEIGRISKEKITKKEFQLKLIKHIKYNCFNDKENGRYYELPLPKGWINF
jgi:hypothetical protein